MQRMYAVSPSSPLKQVEEFFSEMQKQLIHFHTEILARIIELGFLTVFNNYNVDRYTVVPETTVHNLNFLQVGTCKKLVELAMPLTHL